MRLLRAHLSAHNAGKKFALKSQIISDLSNKVKAKNEKKKSIKLNINSYKERGGGDISCPIPKCDRKYYELHHLLRHMNTSHGHKKAKAFKRKYYEQKAIINGCTNDKKPIVEKVEKKSNLKSKFEAKKLVIEKVNKQLKDDLFPKSLPKKRSIVDLNSSKSCDNSINKKKVSVEKKKSSLSPKSGPKKRSLIDENEKQWKCDYKNCERRYFEKHNLKRHQIVIHKRISKILFYDNLRSGTIYKNSKFFNPPKVHNIFNDSIVVNTDSNEKVFSCDYKGCTNSYLHKSGLYKHQKSKHETNKTQTSSQNINNKSSVKANNKIDSKY